MAKIIISDLHTAELEENYRLNELSTEEIVAIHGGGLFGRIIGSIVGGIAGFFIAGPVGIIGGISAGGALGDEIQDAL
jgi:hypothetical protein